jgi:hypothetical protein
MAAATEFRTGNLEPARRWCDELHDDRVAAALGICASIFRVGIENPCTVSFDRSTSRTDLPADTSMAAGSNMNLLATTCPS